MRLNPEGKTYLRMFDFCCFCPFGWSLYELTGESAHNEFKTYQNFLFFLKVRCLVMWEFQQCELVKYYRKLCYHILPTWTGRIYLAMAMALNCLHPSDTAFATAFLSAQIPRLLHAFSMLQPVEDSGHFQDIWLCHQPLNSSREHFFSRKNVLLLKVKMSPSAMFD